MIRRVITLTRRLWSIQVLRFLAVGGINTLFGYGVFASLILLHLNYVFAALLGQICGVLFNFQTNKTLVFRHNNNRLILRFSFVYIFTYLLTIGFLRLFNYYSVNDLVGGAILVLPMAMVSYFLNKKFVFNIRV